MIDRFCVSSISDCVDSGHVPPMAQLKFDVTLSSAMALLPLLGIRRPFFKLNEAEIHLLTTQSA
jgi:hypothetical protein